MRSQSHDINAVYLLAMVLFFFWGATASTAQMYNVTFLKDDPNHIKAISFRVGGYTESWNTNQVYTGIGLGADLYFGKVLDLQLSGRNAVWVQHSSQNLGSSSNPYWFNYEEGILGINLRNTYKTKNYKVTVATQQNSSTYISPDLQRRTSLALRVGLIHIGTLYDQSYLKAYTLNHSANPANDTTWLSGSNYMNMTLLNIGLSIKNIHYGILSIGNWRRPLVEGVCVEYYADLLPLVGQQIPDNVRNIQTLGYRLGIKLASVGGTGIWLGLEGGDRPGPGDLSRFGYFTPHSYGLLTLGLGLAVQEKVGQSK